MEQNLSGLDVTELPPILPGTANELLAVNSTETGYELIPTENVIPQPISAKQILNSTGANVWDWTNDPKAVSISADTGNGNGFKFDQTTSRIISELNTTKIINQAVERVLCTETGVDIKGDATFDSLITIPASITNGILGSGTSNRILIGANDIRLSVGGTNRVSATANGLSLTGSITQNNAVNTNTIYGNTTFSNGTLTISQPCSVSGSNNITLVSGSLTCTNGQVNGNNIKTSNLGTAVLCAVRVAEDNCGLYQSSTGNLDIVAGGTVGLNITSSRVQANSILNFNRGPAFQAGIYTIAQANNIQTLTQPLLIAITPASGTIDFEFSGATSYFGGQQFQIIVRNVGAGSVRYRAQSTTYHITGGAAAVTIASNTYHTLVNDRYHILICNVDSNTFYLIQT